MAGAKEIRSKIASVQNTQKITKAMDCPVVSVPLWHSIVNWLRSLSSHPIWTKQPVNS